MVDNGSGNYRINGTTHTQHTLEWAAYASEESGPVEEAITVVLPGLAASLAAQLLAISMVLKSSPGMGTIKFSMDISSYLIENTEKRLQRKCSLSNSS